MSLNSDRRTSQLDNTGHNLSPKSARRNGGAAGANLPIPVMIQYHLHPRCSIRPVRILLHSGTINTEHAPICPGQFVQGMKNRRGAMVFPACLRTQMPR